MPSESKAERNARSLPSGLACPPVLRGKSERQDSITHLDRVQVFLLGNKPTALLKGAKLPCYLNSWARAAKLEILQYSVVNDLPS